jgi:hypothetical protein
MRSIIRLLVTMAVIWSAAGGQFTPQGGKLIGSRSLGIANQGASLSLFNPVTTIWFEIPSYSRVRLSVYNTLGEKVADLADGLMNAGVHSMTFDASNISSGVYICSLQAGNYSAAKKRLLVK